MISAARILRTATICLTLVAALATPSAAATVVQFEDEPSFFAAIGASAPTLDFDALEPGECIDANDVACTAFSGIEFTSSNFGLPGYVLIQASDTSLGPASPYNVVVGGFTYPIPGVAGPAVLRQAIQPSVIELSFTPAVYAVGFFVTDLPAGDECGDAGSVEITVHLANASTRVFTVIDENGPSLPEFFGVTSDVDVTAVTIAAGEICDSCASTCSDASFGLDNVTFDAVTPPVCSRIFVAGQPTSEADGRATAVDAVAGMVSVMLEPGAQNVALTVDPLFSPGDGFVDFNLAQIDPALDGHGVVRATDSAGKSCVLPVDFRTVPQGPLDNEVLCQDGGILLQVDNPLVNPAHTSACSFTPFGPGEPPLPPGYAPSSGGDPNPCRILTIDSSIIDETLMLLKKDGTFDPFLRILFSRSTDGGATFPPFEDITEIVYEIADIVPDPTAAGGKRRWSPVKITCAVLTEVDCTDPAFEGLDFDMDGFPLCTGGAQTDCNDQIAAINDAGTEVCNGMDDDCDGVIDPSPLCECGNGAIELREACDDGNTSDGDGCSSACAIEPFWSCAGEPSICSRTCLNSLKNGDFSQGRNFWTFYTNGTGFFDVFGAEAFVRIVYGGSNQQLFQRNIPLMGDTSYRVSFKARHDAGEDMRVRLIKHGAPHTNYGLNAPVGLDSSFKWFNFNFTTPPGDEPDGRLTFMFRDPGYGGGGEYYDCEDDDDYDCLPPGYHIDDVCLEKIVLPCGNGRLDVGEECDDGNVIDGDGCSSTCKVEAAPGCGNGVLEWPREQCDDGNNVAGDECDPFCQLEVIRNNIVVNGAFYGSPPWLFFSNGDAEFEIENSMAVCEIDVEGTNVQLLQRNLALKPDTWYVLSFIGSNTGGDNVRVKLFKDTTPHTNYGLDQFFNLTTVPQMFSVEFKTPPGDPITDARLQFWFAPYDTAGNDYVIDAVKIEEKAGGMTKTSRTRSNRLLR